LPTPRFARDELGASQRIEGPAVIEDDFSTIVIDPGATASIGAHGHLQIDVGAP
jgi:N-methylhydantoinase A/oxoprolinase/acetone carboxylase beta subunit